MSRGLPIFIEEYEKHLARVREEARGVVAEGYWDAPRGHLLHWVVNRLTLQVYVGATNQQFSKRVGGHKTDARSERGKTRFNKAMQKGGVDNFEFVPIEYFPSKVEMNAAEKSGVERLGTKDPPIGYNSVGGGGCVGSEAGIKAAATRKANKRL